MYVEIHNTKGGKFMSTKYKKDLTQRERQFCVNYVNTGNIKEAAISSGYKCDPEITGSRLLMRDDINSEIESLFNQKKKTLLYKACVGYERLAFGNISDAIKLIYCDNLDSHDISHMDLFNIAEIKKPGDGKLEIKFFDRLKALEKLQEMDFSTQSQDRSFYNAIENGFKALNNSLD